MTKVIFIATLSLLTVLRAAGVTATPAAPEPWRVLKDKNARPKSIEVKVA